MNPLQHFIQSLRQQIAKGEMELALDRLENYLSGNVSDLRDEAIMLKARYNRLRRNERKGVISQEQAQVRLNRLNEALLDLLEDLPATITRGQLPVSAPAPAKKARIPQEVSLEKVLGINNLKQISWIKRGIQVSESVCRVLTPDGRGTGFLVFSGMLMTNHHVIPNPRVASKSMVEFNYQYSFANDPLPTCRYELDVEQFHSSPELDYTIVGVLSDPDKPPLREWGFARLNPNADPVPGEHVIIIQHPNGGPKQITLTANQVVSLWEHRLHYTTDTMPGSSGAPVFNDSWEVIAIHHSGGDLQVNAKGEKRFINEGILVSAIRSKAGVLWPG
jgi:V8-like Glu-specific endopeptidase